MEEQNQDKGNAQIFGQVNKASLKIPEDKVISKLVKLQKKIKER